MSDIQDLFKAEKEAWIESCRSVARTLLARKPAITIEDVLELNPRPDYVHKNATGVVFKHKDFKPISWRASRRAAMNHRYVRVWVLADQ